MNVLIALGNISPSDDANTNIAKLVARELAHRGHKVSMLGTAFVLADKKEMVEGIQYYRLVEEENNSINVVERIKDASGGKGKIKVLLENPRECMCCFGRYVRARLIDIKEYRYKKAIKKICKDEKIDLIIAITSPIYVVKAALKGNMSIPVVWYQLDPYSTNPTLAYVKEKNIVKKEQNILKQVKRALVPQLVYKENLKNELSPFVHKMRPVNFPNVRQLEEIDASDDICLPKGKTNCVFVGIFYEDIRNPEYLMKMISLLSNSSIQVHFIGDGAEMIVNKYLSECGEYLQLHGRRSLQAAINAMLHADVLINVGNSTANMLPSKINDYISTGKPIVNLCSIDNCPSIQYLEKYPCCLNLLQSQDLKDNMKKFQEFVLNNSGEERFENIQKLYYKSTPQYIVDELLKRDC